LSQFFGFLFPTQAQQTLFHFFSLQATGVKRRV
jgi:hypothetical protein